MRVCFVSCLPKTVLMCVCARRVYVCVRVCVRRVCVFARVFVRDRTSMLYYVYVTTITTT